MMAKKEEKRKGEKTILDELTINSDGKWPITLEQPFKFGSKEVKELILAEPKAKHLRTISSDANIDDILKIVADLAGEPDSLIDELSMADANRVCEFFGAFG